MTLEEIQAQIEAHRKKTVPLQQYPTGPEFGEELRGRLTGGEDMSGLIKRIAEQRSRLLSIAPETRAEMPIGAFSPTQVAGLIAEREEPVRTTWETLRGVKTEREGRLEEIIERATKGYEAQIEKQESKYEQERQKLQDLIEERDYITRQEQWEKEFELEKEKVGGEGENREAIIDALAKVANEDLSNVPAEYRGEVAVKLAEATEEIEWSKETIQRLKKEGNTDDEILMAAKEDGVEEQVRKWLEEMYQGGGIGNIADIAYKKYQELTGGKGLVSGIKSWLTTDLSK